MCRLLGVGPRSLRDFTARGIVKTSPQKGRFLLVESVSMYTGHLREVASQRKSEDGVSLTHERAALAQIDRQLAEIKLKNARGDMLDVSEVGAAWGEFARSVQLSVMGLAGKARSRIPHLTAHDAETLKDICREILEMLAENVEDGAVIGASPAELTDV
jgi:phage terminase Nu1 subunit (DNA packaging protein)